MATPPFIKFIDFKIDNAYIATPWLNVIDKHPGWNGGEPFYQVNVIVKRGNPAIANIEKQIKIYQDQNLVRLGYHQILKDLDFKKHDQEIEILTNHRLNIGEYYWIAMKAKKNPPRLLDMNAEMISPADEKARRMFVRGAKVSLFCGLGVHSMGQPFLHFKSIQYAGEGFSRHIKFQERIVPTPIVPTQDEFTRRPNLGINGQPPMAPKTPDEEEMYNQIISVDLNDNEAF